MSDNSKKILAENIRVALARKHWSQANLARKAGIKPQHLSRYMQEKIYPTLKNLKKIAIALDVAPDILTDENPELNTDSNQDIKGVLSEINKHLTSMDTYLKDIVDFGLVSCPYANRESKRDR